MIISIHQPNYLPWMGYFHKIARADIFVILDNVQYVKGTVANRNTIKGVDGKEVMLSASAKLSKGAYQSYNEIEVDYDSKWHIKHLNMIKNSYAKAPNFKALYSELEAILRTPAPTIASLNTNIIKWICATVGIDTSIEIASETGIDFGVKNDQNLNICKHFGGTIYLSGNGAKKYNDEALFDAAGVKLLYTHFTHPSYPQLHGEFLPNLSIIDALMMLPASELLELIMQRETKYE